MTNNKPLFEIYKLYTNNDTSRKQFKDIAFLLSDFV